MFKWYKKFINRYYGEICDICGKRAIRSKAGALIHYSSSSIYVHSEHIIKSKKFRDMINSEWYKNFSKTIKGVSSLPEKKDDSDLLGALVDENVVYRGYVN